MGSRKGVRCGQCNSLERTRFLKLLLDKYDFPRPGIRVLHLAPEKSLFDVLTGKNVKYDPVDIEPKNFPFCLCASSIFAWMLQNYRRTIMI
ncbi:hypothetical protein RUM4293_01586 [Ruegeria atlantica]|uniref:Uncharacterized protein n=1 Tax=Ruegeria atlantica TaxID=81569 RepID=A0A0P1E3F5_9RHOB|nr:hypothetical protein RUM4293_01586 [Ruegeria atlantica]